MKNLQAERAYEEFDILEKAHLTVLENAARDRPWEPSDIARPGVKIDEDVYAEGILRTDPREEQSRHDLLIDGRLERYRQNIESGQNKWDLVLVEQDFYEHPEEFEVREDVRHNRDPEAYLRAGDGDLIFLDLDRHDIHMVEIKPHDGYAETNQRRGPEEPEPGEWREDDPELDEDIDELQELEDRQQSGPAGSSKNSSKKSQVAKKVANWREACNTVFGEPLQNDWTVYRPEFVSGSNALNVSNLSQNPEYALPAVYTSETGYALGSEEGFEKAESSEDLEALNELFFRGEITEILDGERPELQRKSFNSAFDIF